MITFKIKPHSKLYSLSLLLLITILAFVVRIYKISDAPKGALIDESHFGYLAYSLLETGKDEHGVSYPILFRGFGDQKLPAGAYLMMPVVKFFGLSNTTIRYPSIVAGTLLIIGVYWLLKELDQKEVVCLTGTFVTALSPWTFFLSRFGFESNLALVCFVFGLAALLKAVHTKKVKWMVLAGVLVGFTWYAYIAYRPVVIAVTFLWLTYVWYFQKQISFKLLMVFMISVGVTILPLFQPSATKANTARFSQVGIFSDPGVELEIDENLNFCGTVFPVKVCRIVWNKPIVIARILGYRYIETFSPQFLATQAEGKGKFLTVDQYGQFYLVLYPFFIFGLAFLLFENKQLKLDPSIRALLLLGLLLAPLPSVLVGESQKVRISVLYPFVLLTMMIGLTGIIEILKKQRKIFPWLIICIVTAGVSGQAFMYLIDYYAVHSQKKDYAYQSYLPELMTYLNHFEPSETLINLKPFYSDPLMFYAYYTHMDPQQYQQKAVLGRLEESGFQHTVELGNIWAKSISPSQVACAAQNLGKSKALHVTDSFLVGLPIIKEIKSSNGVHTYVYVYDVTGQAENCNQ